MILWQLPPGGVGFAGFFTTEAVQRCDGRKHQDQLGVAQVVQHLPCKCDTLRSNPSTAKKTAKQKSSLTWPLFESMILLSY
jgi:hypothetical protein